MLTLSEVCCVVIIPRIISIEIETETAQRCWLMRCESFATDRKSEVKTQIPIGYSNVLHYCYECHPQGWQLDMTVSLRSTSIFMVLQSISIRLISSQLSIVSVDILWFIGSLIFSSFLGWSLCSTSKHKMTNHRTSTYICKWRMESVSLNSKIGMEKNFIEA